jgi:ATPase family associated with various cellular activities (AAA)
MRPSHLAEAITALLPNRVPIYVWGPPGVGKSTIVVQAAAASGFECRDVRAVLLDPVDLRGLPAVDAKKRVAHWCPPAFLPHDPESKGVLFLDELAQAPPMVQAGCLQLTLDRRIGEYQLPEGWIVVAASNRQEDRAGAHRLISPLLNRFIHLDLEVDHDDWQAWAVGSGVAPEVRSFLRFKPGLMFHFEAKSNQRAFPTPRSWSFVSQVLPGLPEAAIFPVVSGTIGEGPAAEFIAYLRVYRALPDIDEVMKHPTAFKVPTEPSVLYALCGAVSERTRKLTTLPELDVIPVVANRLPKEFGVLLMADATRINDKIPGTPTGRQWLKANRDVMDRR